MLLFMDSFDHYDEADFLKKWTTAGPLTSVAKLGTAYGRFGRGLYVQPMLYSWVGKTLSPATPDRGVLGVANRASLGGGGEMIGVLYGGTPHFHLVQGVDGRLFLCEGGTGATLAVSSQSMAFEVWRYIELKWTIAASGGTVTVLVNGEPWILYTGDTQRGDVAEWNQIFLCSRSYVGGGYANWFDDLYVLDQSGDDNDFWGDCKIMVHRPVAAGSHTDWTPSGGANYENVDDALADGDASYNSTLSSGIDSFEIEDLSADETNVLAIQLVGEFRKEHAGPCTLCNYAIINDTPYEGATRYPGTTWDFALDPLSRVPITSGEWTDTVFNAMEGGYERLT